MTIFILWSTLLILALVIYRKKSLNSQEIKEEAKASEKIEPPVEKAKAVKATVKKAKTSKKQK